MKDVPDNVVTFPQIYTVRTCTMGCGKATRGSARCCGQKWMRHLAQLARGRLRPQGPLEGRRLQKRSKQIQLVICNPEKGLQVAGSTANPVGGR